MEVRLVDRHWGRELVDARLKCPGDLLIVCPFIKDEVVERLLGDALPGQLRVITRFDLKGFAAGVSDIRAVERLVAIGGQVRGIRNLHAKVFVFGSGIAAVTSANLTQRGMDHNDEFGCLSELPEFVTACRAYFESLWLRGGENVSASKLETWAGEVDRFLASGARPSLRLQLPDYGTHVQPETPPGPIPGGPATDVIAPQWAAEAHRGHIKFFGEGHNRRERSKPVFDEVKYTGCHWACSYPPHGRPRQVADGDVVYLASMVRHPNDTLIFGRAIGRRHRDSEDVATQEEIARRPFKERWPYYIRLHSADFVAGSLSNGITLSSLFDALEANALVTTQNHATSGDGLNTDPRHAIRQQAATRLSAEGLRWLNDQFDLALARHGRIPAEDLEQLDWPALS